MANRLRRHGHVLMCAHILLKYLEVIHCFLGKQVSKTRFKTAVRIVYASLKMSRSSITITGPRYKRKLFGHFLPVFGIIQVVVVRKFRGIRIKGSEVEEGELMAVDGVDGSCAKHLTVEFYMVIYAPNNYT